MKTTIKSALAALISGAAAGVAQFGATGSVSLKGTGLFAGVGALIGLSNFLTHSPLQTPPAAPEAAPEAKQ